MYIKKSFISGMVLVIGVMILLAVAFVFGFTEIHVSKVVCALIWSGCIFTVTRIVDRVERM